MNERKMIAEEMIKELEKLGYEITITKKLNKVWKPKYGDTYYYLNSYGKIDECTWDNHSIDTGRYDMGNCYPTEEQAEFALEKHKIMVQLKRFAEENNNPIDWNNEGQDKYTFYYDHLTEKIAIEEKIWCQHYTFWFSSIELCKQAIDLIGEDNIKKYLFEIED